MSIKIKSPNKIYPDRRVFFYLKNFYAAFIVFVLIFFIATRAADAQTFLFIDETGAKVTSGFRFIQNSNAGISFSSGAPMNKLYFRRSLSFEEPPAANYSFQSETYSIDSSKTDEDTLALLEGKITAPSYSVNLIYLKNKNNAKVSAGSLKSYGFGGSITYKTSGTVAPARSVNTAERQIKNAVAQPSAQIPEKTAATSVTAFGTSKPAAGGITTPPSPTVVAPAITSKPATTNINNRGKKTVSLNLGTGGGSVSGIFVNSRGEPFPAESVVVTVTNGSGTFTKSSIINTNGSQTAYPFQIDGIPQILQGSTDSYKLTVVSNNSYAVNASLPSNIRIYGSGQNVYTQPITMSANRGRLNITLYHGPNSMSESDSMLLTLAQNAVINIPGFAVSCRFTGESPRHFYRYVIDDAPAGKWQLNIMFPGHGVSRQPSVWVPSNASASELFTLTETN